MHEIASSKRNNESYIYGKLLESLYEFQALAGSQVGVCPRARAQIDPSTSISDLECVRRSPARRRLDDPRSRRAAALGFLESLLACGRVSVASAWNWA